MSNAQIVKHRSDSQDCGEGNEMVFYTRNSCPIFTMQATSWLVATHTQLTKEVPAIAGTITKV